METPPSLITCTCACIRSLGLRVAGCLPELVPVAMGHLPTSSEILCTVFETVPQFSGAYVTDTLINLSKVRVTGVGYQLLGYWGYCRVQGLLQGVGMMVPLEFRGIT